MNITKKDRVLKTINFENPDKIPIWAFNRDQINGDILSYELFPFHGEEIKVSEWGYTWENLGDGTIGQPKKPVIDNWEELNSYNFPIANLESRFKGVKELKRKSKAHFLIAEIGISGFNTYLFLRGFINAMIDLQLKEKKALYLLDNIFEIEREVIKIASVHSFDAIHFADDWGTQKNLMISPQLWNDIFKLRYEKHFEFIHNLGMKIFFHSCGNITDIIPELHLIGVDVINISQPNVVDINRVSNLLKGKQCFMVPVSYQTVSITGKPLDIISEAKRLYDSLGTKNGGFIGYIEEYSVMGMPEENYIACWDAFNKIKLQ